MSPLVALTSTTPLADLEDRDVERAAAEVVDGDRLVLLLVEAMRERRRRRLVDDALDVQAGDLAGVLRRLALRVVEVRRHGDDGVGDLLTEVVLGSLLQLLKHDRRDFGWRVLLAARFDPRVAVVGAHDFVGDAGRLTLTSSNFRPMKRLIEKHGVLGVRDRLPLRNLTDEPFAVLRQADHRRGQPGALLVHDHRGLPAFHDGDDGVRRAEVDSNDFVCHAGEYTDHMSVCQSYFLID